MLQVMTELMMHLGTAFAAKKKMVQQLNDKTPDKRSSAKAMQFLMVLEKPPVGSQIVCHGLAKARIHFPAVGF